VPLAGYRLVTAPGSSPPQSTALCI
jgi:hypothetical protein